jgi:hypothetical protein
MFSFLLFTEVLLLPEVSAQILGEIHLTRVDLSL